MKRYVIIALMMLLGVYSSSAQVFEQMASRSLSAKDGLLCNQIYDIVQDKQGFIWLATVNGISRYDGYSFLNYNMLNGPSLSLVQAALGHIRYDAENDLLWVNSSLSYVSCYSLKNAKFLDYTGYGDYLRTYAHSLYDGNGVWLYDEKNGIRHVVYGNGQFVCTDFTVQNGHRFVKGLNNMFVDSAHKAWVITKEGLYRIDGCNAVQKLRGKIVSAQCIDDKMAFLTEKGMFYLFDIQGRMVKKANLSAHLEITKDLQTSVGWNQQWLLFQKKGVYALDIRTLKISQPADFQLKEARVMYSDRENVFVASKDGDMLVLSSKGICRRINLLGGAKDHGNRYRKYNICAMSNTRFLIASYGNGAFVYDLEKGVIDHTRTDDGRGLLTSNFLTGAFIDQQGNLWLAQEEAGLVCLYQSFNIFMSYLYPVSGMQMGDNSNAILRILTDASGKPQIICKNKTAYQVWQQNLSFGPVKKTDYCAYSTLKDSKGHFWEGLRGGGLLIDGKPCREMGKGEQTTINDVYAMKEDKMGRIWIATMKANTNGGLQLTRYVDGKPLAVKRFLCDGNEWCNIHSLWMDNEGVLWIATSGGLAYVDTKEKNITDKSFHLFSRENGKLPFSALLVVRCTANGEIWTGGIGTGLLRCRYDAKRDELKWEQYSTDHGLGSNNVYSILDDSAGFIWVGTDNGLGRVDVKTGRVDNNVVNDDIQSNSYQENSAMRLVDGRLLFGTNNGMVVIDTYQAATAHISTATPPTITDLLIDGISVYKMDGFEGAPSALKKMRFGNDQNTITFSFSNFNYQDANASVYQYYLEGVDKTWNHLSVKNSVTYNGLQPGDYVFHIRSMVHGNVWSKERILKIHISEPWYNMWYSWVFYLLVVSLVAYYLFKNRKEKFQLNQRMKMEKQVNDFRINFFTHVTHEFRTPLAIIQSAVGKIVDEKTGSVSRSSIQTAVRGTKRLSRLVTQLMEFRKISSDGIRLQVLAGVEIVGFVRDIYQDFWYVANQKGIAFNFRTFEKKYEMTCDRHIVETVVYNLLSNALKYTPNRGEVKVRLEAVEEKNEMRIIVADSGSGISEEQQKKLFQPFMHGYVSQGGMGIGLYVAKMMAEKHHGSLIYERSEELGGAAFIFAIPLNEDGYTSDEYLDTMAVADNHVTKNEEQMEDIREMLPKALNNITVAVIEDDPDMQEQIRTELAQYFKVVAYSNGKQGLEGVLADRPALLVCDVMLPDMNGYDIVKQIKEQPDGYTLPVIMLTALNDEKHQIKGYKAGADDYMVKPCNFRLLLARIVQLITWSQKLSDMKKSVAGSSAKSTEVAKPVVMDKVVDKKVLDKFETIVAQHLGDSDFTIDTLAGMMHMGRTKLYGKIKELTGESPNKYIMKRRMALAGEMLLTGEYTVSDVCYKVGLEDVSYFSKCFKSFFGVPPGKYGK